VKKTIINELTQIQDANDGLLRPVDVVEFAKDPETALHSIFEWDDAVAGQAYRLWQARHVISVHVTVLENTETSVRAFVSLMEDRNVPGGGYRGIEEVMTDTMFRASLVRQYLKESQIFRKKYSAIKELESVFDAMDRADVVLAVDSLEPEEVAA
jgi:hypothetical protein